MDTAADPFAPKQIGDMAGATDWSRLRTTLLGGDPPNLVLVGGAGIGKSCALRLILGSSVAIWLRASQDPTLRDNRERIKAAARRRVAAGSLSWIVLEHADAFHADAQAFLRRIIETSLGSCRFVLEVRDAAAISEPLLSRCLLFQAPSLLPYEIRGEILRRAPTCSMEDANCFAEQSRGNIRWAILQGLSGSSDGFLGVEPKKPADWGSVLAIMEEVQSTGTSPRAFVDTVTTVWDRPGGVCPWSLLALDLSRSISS